MIGTVDDAGRALVGVTIVTENFPQGVGVEVWIDYTNLTLSLVPAARTTA
jgi:hypothetical protein